MRFIGMLLIWVGGSLWLYVDLQEPIQIVSAYWKTKAQPADFTVFNWIKLFAQPLFVFGVMCAVAMPKLGGKKKNKAKKPAKGVPVPVAGSVPAPGGVATPDSGSGEKSGDRKTDKPSS
jgi:hypothetical protein